MNFEKNDSPLASNDSSIEKNEKTDKIDHFNYSIRYVRCLLRILCIWQLVVAEPTRLEKHLSTFFLPFVSILMITLVLPLFCHFIFRPVSHFEMILLLGPFTFQTGNIIMHFILLIRSKPLKLCVQHMEHDWLKFDDPTELNIMKKHVRDSHILTLVCISFMYGSAISYFLIWPLLSGNALDDKNGAAKPRTIPGTEDFFNAQANVLYKTVFCINFISALFHYTVTTAVCNLAIVLVSHACGLIQIIIWNLENFIQQITDENSSPDEMNMRIRIIIEKHVGLLKFVATTEEALKEIFLVQVVASTLIMCFIEYDIIIVSDKNDSDFLGTLTYVILFIAFAFNLFLFCRFGEVLKEQSQEIGRAAYMVDWYRLPGKSKLAIMMIINMADLPCELTAGGIMELSIASFGRIVKTSLAYFNMLRKMG